MAEEAEAEGAVVGNLNKNMKKLIKILFLIIILIGFFYAVALSLTKDIATEEQKQYAKELCISRTGTHPEREFESNGCTLWPDWKIVDCCLKHDMDYWCGGDKKARAVSDREFRHCVKKNLGAVNTILWVAVRIGGTNRIKTPWRWGYGFDFPKYK